MLLASIPLAAALAGCATTQDENARLEITAARDLASQKPAAPVKAADPHVKVTRVTALAGKPGGAIVAVLRNDGSSSVNDLPLAAGVGDTVLNGTANVPYFQTHAPAIAPGGEATFVFTSHKPLPAGAPFVRVGRASKPPTVAPDHLAELRVTPSGAATGPTVHATIDNTTGVPQYALDVFAVARRGERFVAAGQTVVDHLGADGTTTVSLPLVGDAKGARLQLSAPPTLFK